jgi:hypothetical protein
VADAGGTVARVKQDAGAYDNQDDQDAQRTVSSMLSACPAAIGLMTQAGGSIARKVQTPSSPPADATMTRVRGSVRQ